jgi:Rnl2 family RNA ligase
MEFIKYASIENAYQTKHIKSQLNRHPEVEGCKWAVTEKIDGSNYNITITQTEVKYGKRTSFIDHSGGVSFQGDLSVITTDEFKQFITDLQELGYDSILLYGELFGEGIQRRIHYCKGKRILFYDIVIDGVWLSVKDFYDFMGKIGYSHLTVPLIEICETFNDALDVDNEYQSKLIDDLTWGDYHVTEGNVIKPYDVSCPSLYIKNKNDAFADKMKTKKKKVKKLEDVPDDVAYLIGEFKSYCNKNRVLDFFSKEGEIQSPKDIGVYIKGIQRDMVESYLKDHKDEHVKLDQKLQKTVVGSASKDIVELLREFL